MPSIAIWAGRRWTNDSKARIEFGRIILQAVRKPRAMWGFSGGAVDAEPRPKPSTCEVNSLQQSFFWILTKKSQKAKPEAVRY